MQIDLNNLVSITEANQNFSKVARMVDKNGAAVILKNNAPKYVLIEYSKLQEDKIADDKIADDKSVEDIATDILKNHIKAFEELAK